MHAAALAHLRVVDLTDLRGALAGRLLADLGADVVRVEPLDGDAEGRRLPFAGGVAGPDRSLAFLYRHANKRRVRLDLAAPDATTRVNALLAGADVLLENLVPDERHRLGLGPDRVHARHPHLIHALMPDFGLYGPRAAWRLEALPAFAASSALYSSGSPERPPCWLPGHAAHDAASAFACVGVLAAVLDRARHGHGQHVEVAVQEAAISGLNPWGVILEDYNRVYPFLPVAPPRNGDGNYLVLRAADGFMRVLPATVRQWRAFVQLLGRPDALAGEEWETLVFRILSPDVIRTVANECLASRRRDDVVAEGQALGVPIAPVHWPDEFVTTEQTRVRGYFRHAPDALLGDAPFAVAPAAMSRTPVSLRHGASDAPIDVVPGRPNGELPRAVRGEAAPGATAPLAGMRVVSLGVVAVGPEICWLLSELGAEVARIESRAKLDPLREVALDPGQPNRAFTYNAENRGSESVCLDLTTARGRALALELCSKADVVVENNRGGVAAAWGLDYDDVRRVRPDVVYVASQGYGRGGPLGMVQSFGPLNAAFSGVHALWNYAGAEFPCGSSLNHPDHVASKLATVAVLAALEHRRRTGEGQFIDVAQTEAAAFLLGEAYLEGPSTGHPATGRGNAVPWASPHGVYPCAGDDRWCAIAVVDDAEWRALRAVVGWTAEARFETLEGRVAARDEIDAQLAAWTRAQSAVEVAERLQAVGISAMPVLDPNDVRADPHLAARGAIVTVEHPEIGAERHIGNPIRFGRSTLVPGGPSPLLGQHTESVLGRLLGLTRAEVAALVDEGVCR
jgi:crotonobetainyl-CoA:carnitine CoA-transferase CaiB-like acyl-CoA transferase